MDAFLEDTRLGKTHEMDVLWMPEVKRDLDRLMEEMNAHELSH